MIARYSQFNDLPPAIELFLGRITDLRYRYYASDIIRTYFNAQASMEDSIRKLVAIMKLTGVSTPQHIQHIYRSNESGITDDWRLTSLACSLMILSLDDTSMEAREIRRHLLCCLGI